ncbi:DUF2927 domain-containing protein [Marivivens donghaensis]|jgi:hypothetical protein|uniref:DUF2927 domain-containing protein n=1 Tax=Marivivens donghaensis TaxID=1699413 RepID=UPI003F69BBA4
MNGWGRRFSMAAAGLMLAACVDMPSPPPTTAPSAPVTPSPEAELDGPSQQSQLLSLYYQRLERNALAQGLMRTDDGHVDAPFTDTQLTANFIRIALFDEYTTSGGSLRARATSSALRRWDQPIQMNVQFGANVPSDIIASDRRYITSFASRLASITGLRINQVSSGGNFHVLILNEDDRLAAGPLIRSLIPSIDDSSLRYAVNLPRDQLCVVIGTFKPDGHTYQSAVAIIRAEHPALMRQSCYHEELSQGLGLANDSPRARPSIFNDDDEFALLTRHDELLLKILYDPRLSTGMTEAEATPIVRQIAAELVGGPV